MNNKRTFFISLSVAALFASKVLAQDSQQIPDTTDFMNAFAVCAVEKGYNLSSDVEDAVKTFYNTRRRQGKAELTKTGDFLSLFPAEKRSDMYTVYVNCVLGLLNKHSKNEIPQLTGKVVMTVGGWRQENEDEMSFYVTNIGQSDVKNLKIYASYSSTLIVDKDVKMDPQSFCVRQYAAIPEDKCEVKNEKKFASVVEIEKNLEDITKDMMVATSADYGAAWTSDVKANISCDYIKPHEMLRFTLSSVVEHRSSFAQKSSCPEDDTGNHGAATLRPWYLYVQAETDGGGVYLYKNLDLKEFSVSKRDAEALELEVNASNQRPEKPIWVQ